MGPTPFTGPIINPPPATNTLMRLYGNAGSFTSVGGVDTDIFTFTIPANTMTTLGDSIYIQIGGKSTGAEAKTARVRIGSIEICAQLMTTAANDYFIELYLVKETAGNAAKEYGRVQRALGFVQSIGIVTVAIDWTVDNPFIVRLQTVTNGTIDMQFCTVDLIKAPV